jgi:hypothetical protein
MVFGTLLMMSIQPPIIHLHSFFPVMLRMSNQSILSSCLFFLFASFPWTLVSALQNSPSYFIWFCDMAVPFPLRSLCRRVTWQKHCYSCLKQPTKLQTVWGWPPLSVDCQILYAK